MRKLVRRRLLFSAIGLHYLLAVVLWVWTDQHTCSDIDARQMGGPVHSVKVRSLEMVTARTSALPSSAETGRGKATLSGQDNVEQIGQEKNEQNDPENTAQTGEENTVQTDPENIEQNDTENTGHTDSENTEQTDIENTEQNGQENTEKTGLENTEQTATENTEQNGQENKAQTNQENNEQTGQENTEQTGQENTENTGQENAEQTGQENTEQTGQENTEQTGQENTENTGQENTEQAGQENTEQAGQENSAQAGQENIGQSGEQNAEQNGQENKAQSGQENTEQKGQENTGQSGQENTEQNGQENKAQSDHMETQRGHAHEQTQLQPEQKSPKPSTPRTAGAHKDPSKGQNATGHQARPDSCDNCFHAEFPTVLDQPDLCETRGNQPIDIVFLITSAISHTAERLAIRQTWASVTQNNTSNFRHVFLFGTSSGSMSKLEAESRQFRDVVVMGFRDSYRNLTLKTISSLHWLTSHCRHARHFMKVDDDVWVNTTRLLALVSNHSAFFQQGLSGHCHIGMEVERNQSDKWFTSALQFPRDIYPNYCVGFAYLSSVNVAEKVTQISPSVPFFQFEDVYVGLCMEQLGYTVKRVIYRFYEYATDDVCQDLNLTVPTLLDVSPKAMVQLWDADCPDSPPQITVPPVDEKKTPAKN